CYGKYDFFLQGLPRKLSDLILRKTVPTVYMTHCCVDFISPDFVLRKTIPTIYMAHCSIDLIAHIVSNIHFFYDKAAVNGCYGK
ncbi:hypothetical protein, partial [Escherichia coli]